MAVAMTDSIKTAMAWFNRFSGWLLLLAIIWLCWSMARIFWLILAPPVAPYLPVVEQQAQPQPTTNVSSALNIFMTAPSETPVSRQPPPQVALKGVMIASPDSLSSAMLEFEGKVMNYRIGKPLGQSGYKLIDVAWNQVIIADDNDNQVVIDMPPPLNMNQDFNSNASANGISNQRLSAPSAASNPDDMMADNQFDDQGYQASLDNDQDNSMTSDADGGESQPDVSDTLNQATEALKQNPASYLSQMGVMATGDGYQVTEAMPAKIRNSLGLETGDRVLSVNGQSVGSDPTQDADLIQQVKKSGEAQIEVQRGEQVISIRQQF